MNREFGLAALFHSDGRSRSPPLAAFLLDGSEFPLKSKNSLSIHEQPHVAIKSQVGIAPTAPSPQWRFLARCYGVVNINDLMDKLFCILETAFSQVIGMSRKRKIPMRLAALSLGVKRVHDTKRMRGLFP